MVRAGALPDLVDVVLLVADARRRPARRSPTARRLPQSDGTFHVEFAAKPDLSVPEKDEPTFQYAVYADVTDTAGETRSAHREVHVGYTALAASMTADEWLTDAQAGEDRHQHADA